MLINPKQFEEITRNTLHADDSLKISLFIVSKTNPRLKKINLSHLSLEQRSAKLSNWAKDNRFVAVLEIGDQLFAHTHAHFAAQLNAQDNLSFEGKKVSVVALTDEQAKQLSMIGEAFEENIQIKDQDKEIAPSRRRIPIEIFHYFAKEGLKSRDLKTSFILSHIKTMPSQIILDCLRRMNKEQLEEKRRAKADEQYFAIKAKEIKKIDEKQEIRKQEIKST